MAATPQSAEAQASGVADWQISELRVYHGATAIAENILTYTPTLATATRVQGDFTMSEFDGGGGEFHFTMTAPADATQVTVQGRNGVYCMDFFEEDGTRLDEGLCAEPFTTSPATLNTTGNTVVYLQVTDDYASYTTVGLGTTHIVLNIAKAGAAPGTPTGVTATAGDASIDVSWTAVTDATSYDVCAIGDMNAADALFDDIDTGNCGAASGNTVTVTTGTSVTLTTANAGITNGRFYAVGVFAKNAGGTSAPGGTGADPVQPMAAALPSLSIAADKTTFVEGTDTRAFFTVTSDTVAPSGGLPIRVTLSGADSFVAEIERRQIGTIAGGTTTYTVDFPIANDETDEPNATATATLTANTAYDISTATATAMINDDDEAATTTPAAADGTFSSLTFYEGTDTTGAEITPLPAFVAGATVTVTEYALVVAAGATDVTVVYATTNPAATLSDDDGNTVSGGMHTFNIGATAAPTPQLYVAPPSGDTADEVTYTFRITREAAPTAGTQDFTSLNMYAGGTADAAKAITYTPDLATINASGTDDIAVTANFTGTDTQVTLAWVLANSGAAAYDAGDSYEYTVTSPQVINLALPAGTATYRLGVDDGTTSKVLTITFTRTMPAVSTDATLATLAIYAGDTATGTALTLTPPFNPTSGQDAATVTYNATVPNATTHATIAWATTETTATVADDYGDEVTSPLRTSLNVNILGTSISLFVTPAKRRRRPQGV